MNIFTKYHIDWTKIKKFLLRVKFLASPDNYPSPSTYIDMIFKNMALLSISRSCITNFIWVKRISFAQSAIELTTQSQVCKLIFDSYMLLLQRHMENYFANSVCRNVQLDMI